MPKPNLVRAIAGFDFERFLQQAGVNVQRVGTQIAGECPYCHWRRTSFYADPDTGVYICHYCDERGGPVQLVADTLDTSYRTAIETILNGASTSFTDAEIDALFQTAAVSQTEQEIELPEDFLRFRGRSYEKPYLRYLHKRNITDDMIEKYKLGYCPDGFYSGRVIIPVYHLGKLVSFVARDITGGAEKKILTPRGNEQGSYLFNYDNVLGQPRIVVVEGVFDALALPDRTVATFGKKISFDQMALLMRTGCNEVVLCWDADAADEIRKATETLRPEFKLVSTLYLPDQQDPSSLGHEKLLSLLETAVTTADDQLAQKRVSGYVLRGRVPCINKMSP